MAADLEKNKKNRTILRTAVTKLTNNIDTLIKSDPVDFDSLEESFDQLCIKAAELKKIDESIEPLLKLEDFEAEMVEVYKYADKISLATFRAKRKIKQNKNATISSDVDSETKSSPTNGNKLIKLPKLNIQKFYGDYTQFTNFWNTFKVSIDDNESLTKIEKFNYLRSYLSSSALNAIEGLEISESNYDTALKILEERFGNKDMIINHHMNKLLNLTPVFKCSDISKLKKLHNDIEINVRSLNALGLEPYAYSSMLIAVVLKLLPTDMTLEFHRQNIKTSHVPDINRLLEFIQIEIESRERSFSFLKSKPFEKLDKQKFMKPKTEFSSAHELFTSVNNEKISEKKRCIFCNYNSNHTTEMCKAITVEEKKNIMKSRGLCFLCLRPKHRIRDCVSRTLCACGGRHNQTICLKFSSNKQTTDHKSISTSNQNHLDKKQEVKNETSSEIISAISHVEKNKIILQTCSAKAKNKNKELIIRSLLDTGSMRSFVNKIITDKLQLKVIRKEKLSVFTFGNKEPIKKIYDVVKFKLENRFIPNSKIEIEALVTDEISGSDISPPEVNDIKGISILQNLTLADSPQCDVPISLLIGADYYYNIVTGNIKHLNKNLVAVETIFGWCLQGKNSENQSSFNLNVIVEEHLISDQIKKFWDLETSGLINTKQDSDPTEDEVMKRFETDVEYENNRYKVKLPWKLEKQHLDNNRKVAENRLTKLNKRFIRNPQLFFEYKEVLNDYLKQGIVELVPNTENKEQVEFYLPHREVIKKDRATSKLRIVFDASAHEVNAHSLNDCLYSGPNLYPEIFDILLRFRLNSVAFTTDMKQAFLQILVDEEDRDVSRFLFSEDPFNTLNLPQVYRFTRVLFGVNCSPFLLAATIKHHLRKYVKKYPQTVNFLNDNIYVDDIIGSQSSVEQALSTTLESIEIFEKASMQLHKWHTNSKVLKELWKNKGIICNESPEFLQNENIPYKVLGIVWNDVDDLLYFDIRELTTFASRRIDTKRYVLQVLGRIFDPIGFLGPFTLRIKCLMQKIWSLGIDWDDVIPEDLISIWKNWCDEIPQLIEFSVPRYCFSEITDDTLANLLLHLFSDASTTAFGTVAYLRFTNPEKDIRTIFVASKNRVAPLKTLTLPRLELMAALCSARLSCSILKALKLDIPCFFWTDSKITFFWIRGSPEKFKPFVKNRVEEIQKLTSPSDWHHCPGSENSADLVSRGAKISKLINDPTWLLGPKWLSLPPEFWPKSESKEVLEENKLEYRKKPSSILQCECVVEEFKNPIDIKKFSNLEKLIRVTAWIKRFIGKLKKSTEACDTLTAEELLEAENYLIQSEQKQFYKEEFESLRTTNSVEKDSSLFNFVPFMDEKEIIRLGGRLEFGDLLPEEKHPIILPKHSWLTVLIIRRDHEKMMHAGTAHTLTKIRSRYWIPKGRQLVKSIIKKCLVCQKYLAKSADQMTAPLPKDRVNEAPPFSICGLDFAGPIHIKKFNEIKKILHCPVHLRSY